MSEKKKKEKKKEPEKQKIKHPIHPALGISLIIIIVAAIVAAVWYFWFYNTDSQKITTYIRPSNFAEQVKKKEEAAGLKTYTNNSAEFSFTYPIEWTLLEGNNTILLSSDAEWPQVYLNGTERVMKPDDIYIQIHFSNENLDISREAPGIKPKITNAKVGNAEARRITYKDDENYAEILPNFKAGNYLFTIIADSKTKNAEKLDAYNKMLASFKFGSEINE